MLGKADEDELSGDEVPEEENRDDADVTFRCVLWGCVEEMKVARVSRQSSGAPDSNVANLKWKYPNYY